MSELDDLLEQILGRHCRPGDGADSEAWRHIVDTGLDRVGIPERLGGVGGQTSDAGEVVIRTARAGLISPLRETLFPVARLALINGVPLAADSHSLDLSALQELSVENRRIVELWHALGVSAHSLGVIRGAVDLATSYVSVRHQFGRPLASHQVVRHHIASAVAELCASETAVSHALHVAQAASEDVAALTLAVGSAKVQTARSARLVARVAHQVHGAIGMTAEHPLHHYTTQLWTLPREGGGPDRWSCAVYDVVRSEHKGDLWSALLSQDRA